MKYEPATYPLIQPTNSLKGSPNLSCEGLGLQKAIGVGLSYSYYPLASSRFLWPCYHACRVEGLVAFDDKGNIKGQLWYQYCPTVTEVGGSIQPPLLEVNLPTPNKKLSPNVYMYCNLNSLKGVISGIIYT